MTSTLSVNLWNVRGLGDSHRATIIKQWMRRFYPKLNILCLQELQAQTNLVEFHLRSMLPDGTVVTDSSEGGRAGSTIVVASNVTVLDSGAKGDGTFTWMKIQTISGPLHIGFVYAPADRRK